MEAETAWGRLRNAAARLPDPPCAPRPAAPGLCRSCCGPARAGEARCYQCGLHAECAPGSLASAVVPIAYAVKGSSYARQLWLYKSGRQGAGPAGRALALRLLLFLRDHGGCVWRRAGTGAGPTHVAVVPSSRGRPGEHPLRTLVAPCLTLRWAALAARPGEASRLRDLDPRRFRAARLPGARVLLLDDTWTTGASAQSAAMALRRAGASAVAVVVLGRHLIEPPDTTAGGYAVPLAAGLCAVHAPGRPVVDADSRGGPGHIGLAGA